MFFYLYRKNGGEVVGMSLNSYALPKESMLAELHSDIKTMLSPKKIFKNGAIVDASDEEKAAFILAKAKDDLVEQKARLKDSLDSNAGIMYQAIIEEMAELFAIDPDDVYASIKARIDNG